MSGVHPEGTPPAAETGGARRRVLLPALGGLTLVLYVCYSAPLSVLLPAQVEAIDPASKVGNLALVTAVSSAAAVVAQPLIGALSDRTRSRLGRRAPWMIAASVAAAGALIGLGGAGGILAIAVLWTVAQFALNGLDIASTSFLVDRIPRGRRGVGAAVFAASAIGGGALGSVAVAPFVRAPAIGYVLLGTGILVATALFVTLVLEPSSRDLSSDRFSWRVLLAGFWIDPRRHPDFAWVLAGRAAFVIGFGAVYGYLLYIATDHLGLPTEDAARLVGIATLAGGGSMILAIVAGGWLSDRIRRRRPFVVIAAITLAVAVIIPLASPTVAGLLAFALLQGIGAGLWLGVGTALASEVLPDEGAAGRSLGTYNLASTLPQAFAPLLAAAVIGVAGYPGLFVVALVFALASGVLVSRARGAR